MTELTTHTLEVPGARLTYDVRRNGASTEPPLMLIGEPMGAAGFGTLSGYFTDRTVITYDPRGVERSQRTDGVGQSTREEHADDVHRVIEAVGGPVDLFASSGGAINALALVAQHPEDVRTLVAPHGDALAALASSWNTLPQDLYLRDGGSYRSRRHACFVQECEPPALVRAPHRAHWQPVEYNALHGGMQRWFEPMRPEVVGAPAWCSNR